MTRALATRETAELMGISQRTAQRRGIRNVEDLPAEAQIDWASKPTAVAVGIEPSTPGQLALPLRTLEAPNLSEEDLEEAKRRFEIIEPLIRPDAYAALWAHCRGRKMQVIELLAREHKVGARTIYHWMLRWKDGGIQALVTRDRADKGKPRALTTAALDVIVRYALMKRGAYGDYSDAEIFRAYNEERVWRDAHVGKKLGDFEQAKYAQFIDQEGRLTASAKLPQCSYETMRVWRQRIPEAVRVMARDGVEGFSATQEIISHRAIGEVEPLEYVVMDHRRLDVFCMVRDGAKGWKLIRPWLTAAIDMRCRRWLAWAIVETPSSDSIAAVLRRVFLDYGLPQNVYWDNGKDFRCEWLEGRSTRERTAERIGELQPAMRGVLETLGVRACHAIVRRARSKLIEAAFGATANYDRSLPWWCGHKPDARPKTFTELTAQHEAFVRGETAEPAFPPIDVIAGLYDVLLDKDINERPHTGHGMRKVLPTGMGWYSPNEMWEVLAKRVPLRRVDPKVLQFSFQKRKRLTCRQGELRMSVHGEVFHYRLDNPSALVRWNDHELEIGYDPLDLGTVAVYESGEFLGLARNAELCRMGESHFVEHERTRRVQRREIRRAIAVAHRFDVPDAIERARRMAVQPARMDVQREEIEAPVPAAIAAAAEAKREEESFSFASAGGSVDVVKVAESAYRDDDPGDEFDFFSGGK